MKTIVLAILTTLIAGATPPGTWGYLPKHSQKKIRRVIKLINQFNAKSLREREYAGPIKITVDLINKRTAQRVNKDWIATRSEKAVTKHLQAAKEAAIEELLDKGEITSLSYIIDRLSRTP